MNFQSRVFSIIIKMKLPAPLVSLIYKCDLFSSKVGFRIKQERQYASMTGGIISIFMIFFFIGIFTNTGINTINKEYIIATQNKKIYENPSHLSLSRQKSFYFTLGLSGIDMNKDIRYFDVSMTYSTYITTNTTKKIKNKATLEPCKKEVWAAFNNDQLMTSINSLDIEKWLCPPSNDTFEFKGKYTSQQFQFIKISVEKCNNATDPMRRCATDTQLSAYLAKNQVFTFNFYFINTILNPEQKDHIRFYLEDKNYFPFTLNQGLTANLYISEYNVQTDQSLLPIQEIEEANGGIVSDNAQIFPYAVTGTQYVKFYLRKSNQQFLSNRSFRKIDDFLSYIGGLFSAILTFLAIVCFYNELSYELQIAKNIYRYDKDTLLDTNGFHFLNYLIYLFYFILKTFGCEPRWQKMEKYDKSLIQVRKQMDVRLIFKKILFTEKLAEALLTSQQLTALHLQDKITISQAEQIRKNYYLPKMLIQELESISQKQINPASCRMVTQNNEDEATSSQFKDKNSSENIEIVNLEFNKGISDLVNDQICQNDYKLERQMIKTNKQKITNSLSNISFKGKSSKIYLKLIDILNQLSLSQQKGDHISKKILKGISPDIKELLDFEQKEDSVNSEGSKIMIKLASLKSNMFSNCEVNLENQNDEKKINQLNKIQGSKRSKVKFEIPSIPKKSTRQIKQIKDVIFVEDFYQDKKQSDSPGQK